MSWRSGDTRRTNRTVTLSVESTVSRSRDGGREGERISRRFTLEETLRDLLPVLKILFTRCLDCFLSVVK